MDREKYVEEKTWDIEESILRDMSPKEEDIDIHDEMSEIIAKTAEITYLIKEIRRKYKEAGILPAFPANSILEDMMTIADYIDAQVVMFGRPSVIKKSYLELSKTAIEEIKKNPFDLEMSGLKEWIEEGLI